MYAMMQAVCVTTMKTKLMIQTPTAPSMPQGGLSGADSPAARAANDCAVTPSTPSSGKGIRVVPTLPGPDSVACAPGDCAAAPSTPSGKGIWGVPTLSSVRDAAATVKRFLNSEFGLRIKGG